MAWIELHQGLREHKKMFACAEWLKISQVEMIGTLVCLWLWALDNAENGSLKGISNRTVARVCGYNEKKADQLVNALCATGWLDRDNENDCLVIHDWYDYAGKLMEQRGKDRERKRKGKENKRNSAGIPTEFQRNGSGIPGATVPIPYPNPTVPEEYNHTSEVNKGTLTVDRTEGAPAPCDGRSFTEFWKNYPPGKGGDREEAWKAWKELNPSTATAWRILDALRDWSESSQWAEDNGRYIPGAAKFLREQKWRSAPDMMAAGPGDSDEPYAETAAYIHRLMAERKDGM